MAYSSPAEMWGKDLTGQNKKTQTSAASTQAVQTSTVKKPVTTSAPTVQASTPIVQTSAVSAPVVTSAKTVKVGADGNAPAGLNINDLVQTAGGYYQIVAPGTSGATYNPATGYYSMYVGTDPSVNKKSIPQATTQPATTQADPNAWMNGFSVVQPDANGNAPANQPVGTIVSTAGGKYYEIVTADTPGATYNEASGYWSREVSPDYVRQKYRQDQLDNYQYGQAAPQFQYDAAMPQFQYNAQAPSYQFNDQMPSYQYNGQMPTYQYDQQRPEYQSAWQQQINDAVAQALGYNFDAYKQSGAYKDLEKDYTRLGQRAMQDTLGQVSARTGGMASSYAGSVAQEAYGNYMQALGEAARNAYQQDKSDKQAQLNLLMALEDQDYNRYADQLQQWNADRGFEYNKYADALQQYNADRNFAYDQYADQLQQWNANRNFAYNQYADALQQYNNNRNFAYNQYADQLQQYNADRNFAYNQYADQLQQWNTNRTFDYGTATDAYERARQVEQENYNRNKEAKALDYDTMNMKAELLASVGDFSGYKDLLGLSGDQAKTMESQWAQAQALTQEQQTWETKLKAMDLLNDIISTYGYVPTPFQDLVSLATGSGGDGLENAVVDQIMATNYGIPGGSSGGSGGGSRRSSGGSRSSGSGNYSSTDYVEAVPYDAGNTTDTSSDWSPKQVVYNQIGGDSNKTGAAKSSGWSKNATVVLNAAFNALQYQSSDRASDYIALMVRENAITPDEGEMIRKKLDLG